jgi:tetratricopeptide (TPR) repeat protein
MQPTRAGSWFSALVWVLTALVAGAGGHWLWLRHATAPTDAAADAPDDGAELAGLGRGALAQCLDELKDNPDNRALRERIVRLAARSDPPPAIPDDALDRRARGREIFSAAETIEDVGRAIDEFQAALLIAPWWPEANRDLGFALEMARQHEEALAALRLYLASGPAANDARPVADEVRRIEGSLCRSAAGRPDAHVACDVLVPTLVSDYWFYVDGRLVSAPPHEEGNSEFLAVDVTVGTVFMDDQGAAARAGADGRLTYVREDVKDKVLRLYSLDLAPGTHRFELLLLNASGFPLAVRSETVEIEAGGPGEFSLGLPPDYTIRPGVSAVFALPYGESWQQRFDRDQAFLKGRIAGLAADPVAQALSRALLGLRLSPPARAVVPVELPEEFGGRREMDARLVSALIRHLGGKYAVHEELASGSSGCPADYRNALARLLPLLRAHNARLKSLEEIGDILAKAGSGSTGGK